MDGRIIDVLFNEISENSIRLKASVWCYLILKKPVKSTKTAVGPSPLNQDALNNIERIA